MTIRKNQLFTATAVTALALFFYALVSAGV
jgi:hypothetical protein